MSAKNEAVAESIICLEGLTYALAVRVGTETDLREARGLLKDRLIKELDLAEGRGANP